MSRMSFAKRLAVMLTVGGFLMGQLETPMEQVELIWIEMTLFTIMCQSILSRLSQIISIRMMLLR